jgi:acid phosphatase class B
MKKIILCDIDGTIANNDHRQYFLEGKKDWDGFFSTLSNDLPMHEVINEVNNLHFNNKKNIVFITGRPERYRAPTEEWLSKYFDFELHVFMRKDNDQRDKVTIKKEIFNSYFKSDDIYCVYENDDDLVALWESFGLKTIKIY